MKKIFKVFNIRMDIKTIRRIKEICYNTPHLTVTDFCILALEKEIENWKEVPSFKDEIKLKAGRKLKLEE